MNGSYAMMAKPMRENSRIALSKLGNTGLRDVIIPIASERKYLMDYK